MFLLTAQVTPRVIIFHTSGISNISAEWPKEE